MMKQYWIATLACCWVASAPAELIFTNGPITSMGDNCDQGPSGCGAFNGIGFTYADNFSLASNVLVTGFSYYDFFFQGSPSDYLDTFYSIFSVDPSTIGASPLFAGQSTASIVSNPDFRGSYEFSVAGLNLELGAGVYWLAIKNLVSNGAITTIAQTRRNADVPGDVAIELDGLGYTSHPAFSDRAFSVFGVTPASVPEPASGWLVCVGLLGVIAMARRSSAHPSAGARSAL